MLVIPPRTVAQMAERIERAYRRRHPGMIVDEGTSAGVWDAAAELLLKAHRLDRDVPLDPELFVAVQSVGGRLADPWHELTGRRAIGRYRGQVTRIVRRLRRELQREVEVVDGLLASGMKLEEALRRSSSRVSALGRMVVAFRVNRPDLAVGHEAALRAQHQACPLYRLAVIGLLPEGAYPVFDVLPASARTQGEAVAGLN